MDRFPEASSLDAQGRTPSRASVAAVVVTHNRLALLRECLSAIAGQSRPPERTVVVDNASSDGTPEALAAEFPEVTALRLAENEGATGGFYEGIKAAYAGGGDWIWLLDDDTIPRPDALAQLLAALERLGELPAPALLASRVEWRDGEPHPMNMPIVRRRDMAHLVRDCESGLIPVRTSTWVSLLLSRDAVSSSGLPRKQFFYQADDIEYTGRILRSRAGYLVPESIVEHRTRTPHTALSDGDDTRFYYHARNTLFMVRSGSWDLREKPQLVWVFLESAYRHVRANRLSLDSVKVPLRALRDGLARLEPVSDAAE